MDSERSEDLLDDLADMFSGGTPSKSNQAY